MTTIQVKNMSFTYNGSFTPVFDQVSFNMDTRWKLGFTGRNGRGKTTFMRLLLGEGPKLGTLSGRLEHSTAFDYFPFTIPKVNQMVSEQVNTDLLTYQSP